MLKSIGKFSFVVVVCLFLSSFYASSALCENPNESPRDTTVTGATISHSSRDSMSVESTDEYLPKWYDMIARIPGDWVEYSKETFQLKNIPWIVGVTGATAVFIVTDRQWYWTETKWYDESPTFHRFSNWMVFTGDGRFQFGIVGAFAAYGFVFDDTRALRTASETTEAILACGGVVQFLKHITGRESPFVATKRTGAWRFFPNQIQYSKHVPHYDAFPSGHLATATTTLVVIADDYPELTWFRPVGYVALGAISSSLVAYGIHWWSDYPLALVLGYSFGEIAAHPIGVTLSEKNSTEETKLSLVPVSYPRGAGIGVALSF
ncbi:MAG TPA: phosphatase PAP2 family protein [Candidatus Acidoferrales bacterium]|nr:phosphatase PAP2 family protein [Candidatus Acidoferrales bacterium]